MKRERQGGSASGRVLSSLFAIWLGMAALGAGGCARSGFVGEKSWLRASPRPFSKDVPVPVGFCLVEGVNEERMTDGVRYLGHRYEGQADKLKVRAFYREQMPLIRWSCISDESEHGRYTMRFARGPEACMVEISGGTDRNRNVRVDVRITPAVETTSAPLSYRLK